MTCSLKMEGESYKHLGGGAQKVLASEVTNFSLLLPQICY